MALTKAPLFSLGASGTIADAITFSRWKGRSYVRETVTPANPRTGLQVGMRAMLKFVTQAYGALSNTIKGHWKTIAKKTNITPLNADVKTNQVRARQNNGYQEDPTFPAGAAEAAPGAPAATGVPKAINVTWTDSAGADDRCTFVYMSATGVVVPDISNLIAVVPHGTQKLAVEKLTTGTTYHFQLKGSEKGGTLGTGTADFTGIPL